MKRECGDCQMCCELLHIPNFKPEFTRCKHQCETGCGIYEDFERPTACAWFNCAWLRGELKEEMRPLDIMAVFWSQEWEGKPTAMVALHPEQTGEQQLKVLSYMHRMKESGVNVKVFQHDD